jgi:hypothetical protein
MEPSVRIKDLNIRINKEFKLSINKDSILTRINDAQEYDTDSLFYLYFPIPGTNATLKTIVTIKLIDRYTIIRFESVKYFKAHGTLFTSLDRTEKIISNYTVQDYLRIFNESVITKLITTSGKLEDVYGRNE